jgi:hypothetical protein
MRHVPNLAASVARALPENRNRSLRRLGKPGKAAQQSGFPCPVVAEDGVKTSRIKFGRDAAQGGKSPELLDHIPDGDG